MINKHIIKKSFDDVINKHSDFLYNIEGTLREITDSKEEYKTLKEDIWRFWKQTKGLTHEELIMKGTNGTFFENLNGDEYSVGKTDEMKKFVADSMIEGNEKLLYTMHNHPNNCCLASLEDMNNISSVLEKYKVMMSNDGLMIVKRTQPTIDSGDIIKAYNMMDKKLMRDFDKNYYKDCKELEKTYPDWFDNSSSDYNNYHKEYERYFEQSIKENTDNYINLLNDKLHAKNRNVGLDCYHIPRTPRLK